MLKLMKASKRNYHSKTGCYLKENHTSTKPPIAFRRSVVTIVGAGRVGQTLGRLLADRGFVIDTVICLGRRQAEAARKFTHARRASTLLRAAFFDPASVILITTEDSAISHTALAMSRLNVDWNKKTVLHTSGAMTSRELAALRQKGALVGSLHPLQTFPSPSGTIRQMKKVFYTFEGDSGAEVIARRLVKLLRGCFVKIEAKHKPLYHCAGFFASGGLVSSLSAAFDLYQKIGFDESTSQRMLSPLIRTTIEGAMRGKLTEALTGPVSRGDLKTVRAHLLALSKDHELKDLYRLLSKRSLTLMLDRLTSGQIKSMKRLLQGIKRGS